MPVAKKILILEDNAERRAAMRACIADRFYTFDTRFFDGASEMIACLEADLADAIVISLDNDLDMKPGSDGRPVDMGEGRHVAEFLAAHAPVCPVIIHTSNSDAAVAMHEMLRAADWKTRRVIPMDDTAWIGSDWFFAMRRVLVGPIKRSRTLEARP
jgi:CheY-like chemotaxis protein